MKYNACLEWSAGTGRLEDQSISIEKEGIQLGKEFLDYADLSRMQPVNHRVVLSKMGGSSVTVSMLGFSYDGFWEELMDSFGKRTMEALFMEEEKIMDVEGEYALPATVMGPEERGRGRIMLYPDAVCILPVNSHALRIPLCYTADISLDGYWITLRMRTGEVYQAGKMGYDTTPFAERCMKRAADTKKKREQLLKTFTAEPQFPEKGLFRTEQTEEYWGAAFGKGVCAVELYTKENSATYLYQFADRNLFQYRLEEAMEAVGSHREIIFLPAEQLLTKPLYRMAVHRSEAVRFLRKCSAGRLIHNSTHEERLAQFLAGEQKLNDD